MLTGELPLGRFAPPSQKMPMDARLDDMVLRALAKEPEKRYQRISELKMDVAKIAVACLPETPAKPVAPEVAKPRKPKGRILGKVRSFFDSVRYYVLDSTAHQRSVSQLPNISSEKRRMPESAPRRRWWRAALMMMLLVAVGYIAGFATAIVISETPKTATELAMYTQTGDFLSVFGGEGEVKFPIPYRQPPLVRLLGPASLHTILTECTLTGFKWRNMTTDSSRNAFVKWVAEGRR
jgi:hypothetical protein